jgi:glycosyltransferase involved in cell wall biosynthesis
LSRPGLVTIGQEHMNLKRKRKALVPPTVERYPKLDAVAVLTDTDLRAYRELLHGQGRLARIPNGVRALAGSQSSLDRPTVLAAGRLTRQKGFDLLIPAFGQVVAEHPEWRLRICGHGPLRADLAEQIAAQGLSHSVELAGAVGNMGEEMANASLYVLSSRWEGFPLVLLEAMSKGLAVVATDCPTGPADIIDDHRNGLLVPPGDIGVLAAAIRELIEDEELRRRCAAGAVETAGQYTMAAIGAQWDALFRDLWASEVLL